MMDYSKLEVGIGPYMPSGSIYCPFCGNYSCTDISGRFSKIFGKLACNSCTENFVRDKDSAVIPVIVKWQARENSVQEQHDIVFRDGKLKLKTETT